MPDVVSRDRLVAVLREWAAGWPNYVAAVELLISHGPWLDRVKIQNSGMPSLTQIVTRWWIAAAHMVDDEQYPKNDRAVLYWARALFYDGTVDLAAALADCGPENAALIAKASITAAGADDIEHAVAEWLDRTGTT